MTMQENYLTEENDIPQSDITRLCDNLRKHSQMLRHSMKNIM